MGINKIFSSRRISSKIQRTTTDNPIGVAGIDAFANPVNVVDIGDDDRCCVVVEDVGNVRGFCISKFVQLIHINFGDSDENIGSTCGGGGIDAKNLSNTNDTMTTNTVTAVTTSSYNRRLSFGSGKFFDALIAQSLSSDDDDSCRHNDRSSLRRRHSSFNVTDLNTSSFCHCPSRWYNHHQYIKYKSSSSSSTGSAAASEDKTVKKTPTFDDNNDDVGGGDYNANTTTARPFLKDFDMRYSFKRALFRKREQRQRQQRLIEKSTKIKDSRTLSIHVDRPFMFHVCTEFSKDLPLTLFTGCVVNPNASVRNSMTTTV
ncbi:MAG: hypothetical protein ACRYE7_02265 [Janthinobacterium lividum]